MLNSDDRWIWDFWHAERHGVHHLYYLQAPKALGDPELRHRNATVGHATSTDLRTWTEHGTVLRPGGADAVDATATWTGCVVADGDRWRMFYTGSVFHDRHNVQTITSATSADLHTWVKDPDVVITADPRWYEVFTDGTWHEEAWRDPWVYPGEGGLWHMLITARANTGRTMDRGVVGHATSPDLVTWQVRAPLVGRAGFGHLEVLQRARVGDAEFVVFSTAADTITEERRAAGGETGVWSAPVTDGVIRLDEATNLTGPAFYSGRIVDLGGEPVLLAFLNTGRDGAFLGGVSDPIPVAVHDGRLRADTSAVTAGAL